MDRSEEPIRTAIRLEPDNATAHYFLARILYTENRFDEAIDESKKTIELAPNFIRAYENLGLCYEGKYQRERSKGLVSPAKPSIGSRKVDWEIKTEWPALDLAVLLIHENKLSDSPSLISTQGKLAINPHNTQALVQMGTSVPRKQRET